MKRFILFGLVLVSLMLLGCTMFGPSTPPVTQNDTSPPPSVIVRTPSFTITSPTANQELSATDNVADVTLVLNPQNLVIKSTGGAAKKGEGHFKVTLDNDHSFTVTTRSFTIPAVSIGSHTIEVELVNNDQSSYSPVISKSVSFTIVRETPAEYVPQIYTVQITDSGYSPAHLTVKSGDSITFVNNANSPNSAMSIIGGNTVFNTNMLSKGQSATIQITELGEFNFISASRPDFKGTLTVQSNSTG